MEFNSQICTTREQSKRLVAFGLKKETADCCHYYVAGPTDEEIPENANYPAWSLHRLLFLIPKEVNINGFKFPLRSDAIMKLEDVDDIYDRLIGIIERAIKGGYFYKGYLE